MNSKPVLFLISAAITAVVLFGYTSLGEAHDSATVAQCAANLNQLNTALREYAADTGAFPPTLEKLTPVYVKDPYLFVCPHKAAAELHTARQLRAGIMSLAAGVMALVLSYVIVRPQYLTIVAGVILALALFFGGNARAMPPTLDYTYAPPAASGLLPRLQDNPGNHGPYAINALGPGGAANPAGTIAPVGPNIPKSPH